MKYEGSGSPYGGKESLENTRTWKKYARVSELLFFHNCREVAKHDLRPRTDVCMDVHNVVFYDVFKYIFKAVWA